jgi:hypothetical protein
VRLGNFVKKCENHCTLLNNRLQSDFVFIKSPPSLKKKVFLESVMVKTDEIFVDSAPAVWLSL